MKKKLHLSTMPEYNLRPNQPITRIAGIASVVIMLIVLSCAIIMYLRVSKTESVYTKGKTKVCYFPNWLDSTRTSPGADFTVYDIDWKLCSHVMYAFLGLDETEFTIKHLSPEVDLSDNGGKGLIEKLIVEAAKAEASVLFSVGGWTESGKAAFETLLGDESLMDKFVTSVVALLQKFKAQGLDLDYEYPGCPQGTCKPGNKGREGFSTLVTKLKNAFKSDAYLLTAAVSANIDKIDVYYDAKVLNEHLDWVGLMTYDYSIGTDSVIGVTAPFNKVTASAEAWISKGVDAAKVILGVPLYGVSYTLADKAKTIIGSAATGVGSLKRSLKYNEICHYIKTANWTVSTEADYDQGTYAFKDDQWTGYDSARDMIKKGKYIVEKQLAGYMCWSVVDDDYLNICGDGKFPLLTAISNVLDGK